MTKCLLAIAMLLSVSAQADWSGAWGGSAVYTNDEGANKAFDLEVNLIDDGSVLTLMEWGFGMEYSFNVADGKLLADGKEVGTIAEDAIHVKMFVDEENLCYQTFSINRTKTGIQYLDDYACDTGYFDHIEGALNTINK